MYVYKGNNALGSEEDALKSILCFDDAIKLNSMFVTGITDGFIAVPAGQFKTPLTVKKGVQLIVTSTIRKVFGDDRETAMRSRFFVIRMPEDFKVYNPQENVVEEHELVILVVQILVVNMLLLKRVF